MEDKKEKRNKIILFSVIIILVIFLTGVVMYAYSYFTAQASTKDTISLGNIEITLTGWDNNTDIIVVPGKVIDKVPTITATQGSSYARFVVEFIDGETGSVIKMDSSSERGTLLANMLSFNSNLSCKNVGSSYICNYNTILNQNDKITLFDNLTIPKEWTNSDVDTAGNFKIKISAEAIQSKGFVDATEAFTQLSKEVTE